MLTKLEDQNQSKDVPKAHKERTEDEAGPQKCIPRQPMNHLKLASLRSVPQFTTPLKEGGRGEEIEGTRG